MSNQSSNVHIRRLRADEGPRLREIRLRALAEAPTAFGSTLAEAEQRPDAAWRERAGAAATGAHSVLFVAEEDGRWLGLAGGLIDGETPPGEVELVSMWVDPVARGRGIGRELIEAVLSWARAGGAVRVRLWVTEGNAPAITLYRRCGFSLTSETTPHGWHPDLRELLMQRPLAPDP
ncbi:MAG TPA: GNAT family N-acetyltransferase [Dehalococcoidia bacterium]